MGTNGNEGLWARVWRALRGKPPRVDANVLVGARLPVAAHSATLRARCAAHGVQIPELRTVFVRADAEVCGFEVPSADALPTWQRLHAVVAGTGLALLLFRAPAGLGSDHVAAMARTAAQDTLAAAARVDGNAWFTAALARDAEWQDTRWTPRAAGVAVPTTAPAPLRLTIPYDDDGRPVPGVFVLLLPTHDAAGFPAFLSWGDYNCNARPEEHVAVLRSWRTRFGAIPAAAVEDRLELVVERPPTSLAAARDVAREHACYCEELLAADDLDGYAASLVGAPTWYFWWD